MASDGDGTVLHAASLVLYAFASAFGLFVDVEEGAALAEYLPGTTMTAVGLLAAAASWVDARESAPDWTDRAPPLLHGSAAVLAGGAGLFYLARGWSSNAVLLHLLMAPLFGLAPLRRGGHWLHDVVELAAVGLGFAGLYAVFVEGRSGAWLLLALGGLLVVALDQADRPAAEQA